jgi:pimeloyl-ACP methyl ester carboxylesterase
MAAGATIAGRESEKRRKMKGAIRWLRAFGIFAVIVLVCGMAFVLRPVSFFNGSMYMEQQFSGVENHSIAVDSYRMHYLAAGPANGPVVVLVHGLGGRAEDWRLLSPYLSKAGFRVYMPDLPGYGRSEWPRDFSYSVRDEATVVVDFIKALRLRQVDLGGWSMGGWIVQIAASEHPEVVRHLIVIDSAGLYARPDWDTNLFMPKTAAELGQLEALLMPQPSPIPSFVARDILRNSHEHAWVIKRALDTMMTGNDVTDRLLPQLKMPVLLLWGAEDRITPVALGQKMHGLLPQSELDVFRGCGHLAPEQCTGEMGPRLVEFLKQ